MRNKMQINTASLGLYEQTHENWLLVKFESYF